MTLKCLPDFEERITSTRFRRRSQVLPGSTAKEVQNGGEFKRVIEHSRYDQGMLPRIYYESR